jgi:hypothetical protein
MGLLIVLAVLLLTPACASAPAHPSATQEVVTGVVVARSITKCEFGGRHYRCSENYIIAPAVRDAAGESVSGFLIAVRSFDNSELHPADEFLVDRPLTLRVARDSTCDRLITYEPTGDMCGPGGQTTTYDWRKIHSAYPYPEQGVSLPCFRMVAAVPEFARQ